MIASIKGKLILKKEKYIILENSGMGYKIYLSLNDLISIKQKNENYFFWTYLHVKEDALDLYGFKEIEELEFFQMLLNVSGIGPRSALTILGIATINTLKQAIGTGDISYLTKISGIGKKTAEKIIIELRDKMKEENSGKILQNEIDALEALKSLGYSQNEAREALKKIDNTENVNIKIKEALKILSNNRN